jgi:hypothetical protein
VLQVVAAVVMVVVVLEAQQHQVGRPAVDAGERLRTARKTPPSEFVTKVLPADPGRPGEQLPLLVTEPSGP